MEFKEFFPFWNQLTRSEQGQLQLAATRHTARKGDILHNGSEDCLGLVLVVEGMLRAYTLSAEGREITLYRLYERDICLFSAPCMLHSIQFDLSISAEQDAVYDLIPTPVFRALMQKSAAVANYINELMASRFSDVMWLLDQILSKKMDARLAAFLVEECERYDTLTLSMTHDEIARHLGTAREVVTRMLNYMSSEQIVRLSRGCIEILQPQRLQRCASDSLR